MKPRWPEDAIAGRTPGTVHLTDMARIALFGGRFPAGWRPVASYAETRSWDMARVWCWPVLVLWRIWSDASARFVYELPKGRYA